MSSARLDKLHALGKQERAAALKEIASGKKQGHWIWFVFPTLAVRGGDMYSARVPGSPDLQDATDAAAYAAHPQLRASLVDAFKALDHAMGAHKAQAPWAVLDAGFRRTADEAWVKGPVDSFKVWCSATLFATLAHRSGDDELRAAAVATLGHFKGDVIYSAKGQGTSGYIEGAPADKQRYAMAGPDEETLRILGQKDWETIAAQGGKAEL